LHFGSLLNWNTGKLFGMFKDQEHLLSCLRTRIRINFKGEMTIRQVAGIDNKETKQRKEARNRINDKGI